MRFVPSSEFHAMPWRNGLGTTREVARSGAGEAFDWRISIATVTGSGPFSGFPGIDRTIAVLQGDGMLLDIDDHSHELLGSSPPLSFAGDAVAYARCIGDETTDLNVMTRRGAYRHELTRVSTERRLTVHGTPGISTLVLNGPFLVFVNGCAHKARPLDAVCDIAEGNRVVLEPDGEAVLFRVTVRSVADC